MKIEGIEWDRGNWPKCGKHGVSKAESEHVLQNIQFLMPDPHPTKDDISRPGSRRKGAMSLSF